MVPCFSLPELVAHMLIHPKSMCAALGRCIHLRSGLWEGAMNWIRTFVLPLGASCGATVAGCGCEMRKLIHVQLSVGRGCP